MDRRTASLMLALAPLVGAVPARAQAQRVARVAWVSVESENPLSPFLLSFKRGMRNAGWIEGTNLVLDEWWTHGGGDRVTQAIPGIVARRPEIIVASGGLVVRPLMNAGVTLPMVFSFSGDVVQGGVVESYARPGVNRTGISLYSLDLMPKRLEFMKAMLPGMKRIAIAGWPMHSGVPQELEAAARSAKEQGLDYQYYPISASSELDAMFDAALKFRADAFLVFADGVTIGFAERFAAFSARYRVPAVSAWAAFAEKGNLMTYGPVVEECYARLGGFVDRILKGARAADLPVERPTLQELVINRDVAKQLDLVIPPGLLARADRVIG